MVNPVLKYNFSLVKIVQTVTLSLLLSRMLETVFSRIIVKTVTELLNCDLLQAIICAILLLVMIWMTVYCLWSSLWWWWWSWTPCNLVKSTLLWHEFCNNAVHNVDPDFITRSRYKAVLDITAKDHELCCCSYQCADVRSDDADDVDVAGVFTRQWWCNWCVHKTMVV